MKGRSEHMTRISKTTDAGPEMEGFEAEKAKNCLKCLKKDDQISLLPAWFDFTIYGFQTIWISLWNQLSLELVVAEHMAVHLPKLPCRTAPSIDYDLAKAELLLEMPHWVFAAS